MGGARYSARMGWLDGRILRDLKHAGFTEAERQAVRDTPAMWAQLTQFYAQGGGVERVDAAFSGATGAPQRIRFFCPPPPAACAHSTYDALAHELGHALQCPAQWQPAAHFDSAQAYAHARELGEAHAWLNQYRLSQARQGGAPPAAQVLLIENDSDFGTTPVDIFARIAQREAAGWAEAQILDELAMLNANMYPCGMGEGNLKTYGQCNRWDWLQATRAHHPAFNDFLARLPRPPHAGDQKLLMKFNLFTGAPGAAASPEALQALADGLAAVQRKDDLAALYALACRTLPQAVPGVAGCAAGQPASAPPPAA